MAEISSLDPSEALRARRWDALIIGSGIAAHVAAARIGAAGQRVLIVEEEAQAQMPPAAKEPFFLSGLRDRGVLDACLSKLGVPLIDRRRLANERLAYQIAADPFRLDIGQPIVTAEELVTWGLAKPDDAQSLIRHLFESSEIERGLLLEAAFVRIGRRSAGGRHAATPIGNHKRGLPGDVAAAKGDLQRVLEAQIRSLSNLGSTPPSPEAQTRLLGLGLGGGIGFSGGPPWLMELLRKRVTSLFGDFRSLPGDFEIVSVSGQPGIRVTQTGEIWLGRALILAAPRSALRESVDSNPAHPAPGFLKSTTTRSYRGVFLYRVPIEVLPEAMSARVILPEMQSEQSQVGTVSVTAFPSQTHSGHVDLVARGIVTPADPAELQESLKQVHQSIAERLEALMPFCGDRLESIEMRMPRWDSDDGWLEDPRPGTGWPAEIDLRVSTRSPIYCLDRAASAGLGLEGDLLLGWRGGDAIAAELA
ncbi:MAG: hypothetical protein VCB25_06185 [Myxococcota bacterium]